MQLYNGDCQEILKQIPDKSIDLILTDPPYGTTACKWDSVIPFEKMWPELNRVIKDNAAIVLFGTEPFSSALRMSNIKNYKYDWIWNKKKAGNFLLGKIQPMKIHENISVFGAGKINYYPIKTPQKHRTGSPTNFTDNFRQSYELKQFEYDDKYPVSIQEYSNCDNKNKVHPTQKPVALLEYLIKTYTQVNETVLDFTMGSGSTGVAAVNTNRDFIGIELDENYFKIASERIKKAQEDKEYSLFKDVI